MKNIENFTKINDSLYIFKYPTGEVNIVTVNNEQVTGQIIIDNEDLYKIINR